MFEKYMHLERLSHPATHGILDGTCYVFEKLDGTNGSIWLEDGQIKAGSRNRELSADADNFKFYEYVQTNPKLINFLSKFNEGTIAYGEWMVPHTIKDYPDELWDTFQIFDVKEDGEYLPYSKWWWKAELTNVDFLRPLHSTTELTQETILKLASSYKEGIVIKNYEFINKFSQYVSAKVINPDFGTNTTKAQQVNNIDSGLSRIVNKYLSRHLILKTRDKLQGDCVDRKKLINMIWYDFIQEELYEIIEKEKYPTLNFKLLKSLVIFKIKKTLPDLF